MSELIHDKESGHKYQRNEQRKEEEEIMRLHYRSEDLIPSAAKEELFSAGLKSLPPSRIEEDDVFRPPKFERNS